MKPQYRFETVGHKNSDRSPGRAHATLAKRRAQHDARRQRELEANQREASQLQAMINSLGREVTNLDDSIASEVTLSGAREPLLLAYPISVRMMQVRRDNLKNTMAALTERLSCIRSLETEHASRSACDKLSFAVTPSDFSQEDCSCLSF